MSRHITLLGAGLTGPLLAIYLARRGYTVDLYERRPDMRVRDIGGGRSINLALSTRGIHALQAVGIGEAVLADAIPMAGRMIHGIDGSLDLQPYGRAGQAINSVSRAGLNILLMDRAEQEPGVTIHFSARCSGVDLRNRVVTSHALMTLGILGALAIGQYAAAAVIVFFMRFADFLEGFTTERSRQAIRELLTPPETAKKRIGFHA